MNARYAWLLALLGCAPHAHEPPRYPPLPSGKTVSSAVAAFEPAPELVATSFACRPDEPTLANALDDDCDGKVDGLVNESPLLLVLAYPRVAALQLRLEGDGLAQAIALPACEEAFCSARLDSAQLPRGYYALKADSAADADALPSALLVSVQSQSKVNAYLLRVTAPHASQLLGHVANP